MHGVGMGTMLTTSMFRPLPLALELRALTSSFLTLPEEIAGSTYSSTVFSAGVGVVVDQVVCARDVDLSSVLGVFKQTMKAFQL